MDVQIGKLNEGMKQAAQRRRDVGAHREAGAGDQRPARDRDARRGRKPSARPAKLTKEATTLLDAVRGQVDTLAVKKKEFEAFDERLRALQAGVGDAESRMEALGAKDKNLIELGQKVDGLTKRFETLFAQADELTKKQLVARDAARAARPGRRAREEDVVADGRAPPEPAGPRRAAQGSPGVLQVARRDRPSCATSSAPIGTALEAFGDRMTGFAARAPELEAKMDAILGKMKLVEEGTQKATRLHESVAELDAQISRVSARVPFVEKLEGRLNGLNTLSARRRSQARGAARAAHRARDAQERLSTASARRWSTRSTSSRRCARCRRALVPLVAEVNDAQDGNRRRRGAHRRRRSSTRRRSPSRRSASRSSWRRAGGRDRSRRAHAARCRRSRRSLAARPTVKDELLAELDRVQSRQRDTVGQIQASEDQLARAEKMFKQLEQRRSQVAFGEKKLAAVESRLAEIKQLADRARQEHLGHRRAASSSSTRSRRKSRTSTRSARAARPT